MGNVKELRKENQVQNFGFGTALDAPFVIPLTNSLLPAKGTATPTFTRTTVGTYVDVDGVIQESAIDTPRFEYENGQPKGILIEEARTNLFLNSDAPATQTITVSNATVYTMSVKGSGSIALSGGGAGTATEGSDVTFTTSSTSVTCTLTGSLDYAQLETGSFATSVIVTAGSGVQRTVDVSSYDVTNVLTQGQGSLYVEVESLGIPVGVNNFLFALSADSNNKIQIFHNPSNQYRLTIDNTGSNVVDIRASSMTINTLHKIMITYEDDNVNYYVDGIKIGSDTSCTIPIGLSTINIGNDVANGNQLNGNIKNVKYYKEVLDEPESKRITG